MIYDPSYKTAHLYQYGNPAPFKSFTPGTGAVMQDFVYTTNEHFFVTQAGYGSNGTSTPYESTIITRINPATGAKDSMRLTDAGHGIGIEIEYADNKTWVLMTWRGKTADSGWREYDYVRFQYVPGGYLPPGFARGTVNQQFCLSVIPINDPEMLVHVDWTHGWAVCKHYDSAGNDIYTRRQLWEMKAGIDKTYGRITLPIAVGTLQGFATINDTLYRYMGTGAIDNVMSSADPIAIEEFDWNNGNQIAYRTYPTLGADSTGQWRDGRCEPEGMTTYREADGHASLIVGLTTGNSGNHRWETYKFTDIGL